MRWRYGILCGLILIAGLPLLYILLGSAITTLTGCNVAPSGEMPCLVLGLDLGPALRFGLVVGWLAIYTVPVLAGLGLLLILMALVDLIRYLWRR